MPEAPRHRGRPIVVLLALLILGAAGGYALLGQDFHAPGPAATDVQLKVSAGESTRAVLAQIGRAHV